MPPYDPILSTETDPDQPLKSSLAKRWTDNPIAMGEGASGAPLIRAGWHPYNKVNVGDANDGKYYDFTINGSIGDVVTPTFEDGYDYLINWEGVSFSTGAFSIQGVSISAILSAANTYSGSLEILMPTRLNYPKYGFLQNRQDGAGYTTGMKALDSAAAVPFMGYFGFSNFASALTSVAIGPSSGVHDAGRYYLSRRRNYITG